MIIMYILFLTFQRILDHSNRSSDEQVMIKIQTTAQQIRLHTGHMKIHMTRMLHTRKFEQSWKQLSNWLTSYIRPFQVSFWRTRETLTTIFKSENIISKFERDLAPQRVEFENLHAESKPSSERSSESLNLIFFFFFLMLCALLLFWISIICSWTCVANHPFRGDGL
jgi:hypothetical protein